MSDTDLDYETLMQTELNIKRFILNNEAQKH